MQHNMLTAALVTAIQRDRRAKAEHHRMVAGATARRRAGTRAGRKPAFSRITVRRGRRSPWLDDALERTET